MCFCHLSQLIVRFFSTDDDAFLLQCFVLFLFFCLSLCCGHAVRVQHVSYWDKISLSSLSTPHPIPIPCQGHSVCRLDALDVFCCELSWGILWFMIGLSAASDEQAGILPEAMLGYDESHKMQIAFFFFLSFSQTPKTPDILFISGNLTVSFSPLVFPCLCPHTLPLFSIIYTFKHEIWLIHCEGSQYAAYQCDNQNMSLFALVAPWLEFHFMSWDAKLPLFILSLSLSILCLTLSIRCWFVLILCPLLQMKIVLKVLNGYFKRLVSADMHHGSSQ